MSVATALKRKYSGADASMLIALATLITAARNAGDKLRESRGQWTNDFFDGLLKEIDETTREVLGYNTVADLVRATQVVTGIQKTALTDLPLLKIQIEQDFKSDKPRIADILRTLGYTDFWKSASRGQDQEDLIQLLFVYASGLTPELRAELVAKGEDGRLIDRIATYAPTLQKADISQEGYKKGGKGINEGAVLKMNALYDKVIAITVIARKIFKGLPAMQDAFSYSKTIKVMNGGSGGKGGSGSGTAT